MAAIDYNFYGDPSDERGEVAFKMTLFHQVRTRRLNFEGLWEESCQIAWPDYSGSFVFGREVAQGAKRTQFQLTNAASIGAWKHSAISEWMLTPSNMIWSKLKPNIRREFKRGQVKTDNREVNKDPNVKAYFEDVSEILWDERYSPTANFLAQNSQSMHNMSVFGNMGTWTDELDHYLDPRDRGLRYLSTPVGEIYVIEDHQRRIVGCIRHFRLTAQQARTKFPDAVMPIIDASLKTQSQQLYDFLHFVLPRTDYNPFAQLSEKGKKFQSTYISVQNMCIVDRGGFRTMPLAYGRYLQMPDETYGRGPTQMVLNTLKTDNALWRIFMKTVHRKGDPAYLVADTGLVDTKVHSGSFTAGGINADGKPLVAMLPVGDVQVTQELIDRFEKVFNDAY